MTDPVVTAVAGDLLAEAEAVFASLPQWLNPATAPADVLAWLRHVARRPGGTASALRTALEDRFGVPVEIVDPGGITWSTAATPPPSSGVPALVVRLVTPDPPATAEVEAVVRDVVPAHLAVYIEFVR